MFSLGAPEVSLEISILTSEQRHKAPKNYSESKGEKEKGSLSNPNLQFLLSFNSFSGHRFSAKIRIYNPKEIRIVSAKIRIYDWFAIYNEWIANCEPPAYSRA